MFSVKSFLQEIQYFIQKIRREISILAIKMLYLKQLFS